MIASSQLFITDLSNTYDRLGNPSHVSFSSPRGSYADFVYSATGERLKATHYTNQILHGGVAEVNYLTDSDSDASPAGIDPGLLEIAGLTKLEYHGPVVYRNGKVDMVRFPGGYATITDGLVTFHYYTQDYLGSNRAVVNGSTGAIEQTVAYYPYGSVIADLGTGSDRQPFKFGGKELTLQNGLNEYDFGARQYYPAVPHFTSVDPLCEKCYWMSPYLYCGNNPVNIIDPTGIIWDNPEDINQLKANINNRIQELQSQTKEYKKVMKNEDISEKEKNTTEILMKENDQKIKLLQKNIETIEKMNDDKDHVYTIVLIDSNLPHCVKQGKDGKIEVQASSDSMAVHEITHVGQSLSKGVLSFVNEMLANASTNVSGAAKNEILAYRSQYAMDPQNMPLPTISINLINDRYLRLIVNPKTGRQLYDYLK